MSTKCLVRMSACTDQLFANVEPAKMLTDRCCSKSYTQFHTAVILGYHILNLLTRVEYGDIIMLQYLLIKIIELKFGQLTGRKHLPVNLISLIIIITIIINLMIIALGSRFLDYTMLYS